MTTAAPTPDQLQAALARIRALPRCAHWPSDVQAVLADPVRGRLLTLTALCALRPARPAPAPCTTRPRAAPTAPHAPFIDCKRAASGERDE